MRLTAGPQPVAERRLPASTGCIYHVAPGGNDDAECSAGSPCREIARVAPLLEAGDVLVVADGDYAPFALIDANGGELAPIAIVAIGAGAMVRGESGCDRRDRSCRDAIFIERSQYVVVDGVGASGAARAGLAVELSSHVTVRNAVLAGNGRWGIFSAFADDLVLEHNHAFGSATEHGIYASNSGDRTVIRGNLVNDNRGSGIQINADWSVKDPTGLYPGEVDGITTGAVVEENVVFNNGRGGGGAINLDGVQDSTVRNNLLFANAASGIVNYGDEDGREDSSGDDGDGRQGPSGMVVVHNTVVQPRGGRAALLFRYSAGPNLVRNNILVHADEKGAGLLVGGERDVALLDSDHNVLTRVRLDGNVEPGRLIDLAGWRALGRDRHSLSAGADELFVAPGCDFHLSGTSPARDRGAVTAEAGGSDLLGQPRPRGAAPDLGALEAPPP